MDSKFVSGLVAGVTYLINLRQLVQDFSTTSSLHISINLYRGISRQNTATFAPLEGHGGLAVSAPRVLTTLIVTGSDRQFVMVATLYLLTPMLESRSSASRMDVG